MLKSSGIKTLGTRGSFSLTEGLRESSASADGRSLEKNAAHCQDICKFSAARGPSIHQPWGQPRTFDTHGVSYQNITTLRILLEKQADWLICQGQAKIEEVW